MVLHVNQTAILQQEIGFMLMNAFFSVLESTAKPFEWIVEIANIRKSK